MNRFSVLVIVCWLAVVLTGCVRAEPIILVQTRVVKVTSANATADANPPIIPAVTAAPTQKPVSLISTPAIVRMYLPPSGNAPAQEADLIAWLTAHSTLPIEVIVPQSEAEVLDALSTGDADVAWLATPAYLLANERYGAEAHWRGLRQGMAWYRGQWLVQADTVRQQRDLAPLRNLEDLTGASVGYTDSHSTTGYLFPRALLQQAGIQTASEIFVGGDPQAVLAVYRGEVDAAATFWALPKSDYTPADARALIVEDYPDVFARVQVLHLSDPIPNDPIVYRHDLPPATVDSLTRTFFELARSDEGRAALQLLYGLSGLVPTQDGDYDSVRAMVEALDLDLDTLLVPTVLP